MCGCQQEHPGFLCGGTGCHCHDEPVVRTPLIYEEMVAERNYYPSEILKYFAWQHLPPVLADVSQRFHKLATQVDVRMPESEEKQVALRKLLEAKDAAVRCCLDLV